MYAGRCAKPECMFVIAKLGRWVSKWTNACEVALLRLISYLFWHADEPIRMTGPKVVEPVFLAGFTDADHAGEVATSHSTSGSVLMMLGMAGAAVCCWRGVARNRM